MKFDRSVKKQKERKGYHLYITGPGRVDDSKSIDLAEEVAPDVIIDGQSGYKIEHTMPTLIKFSKEYSNVVYDVYADFSAEGKESVLNQFKKTGDIQEYLFFCDCFFGPFDV